MGLGTGAGLGMGLGTIGLGMGLGMAGLGKGLGTGGLGTGLGMGQGLTMARVSASMLVALRRAGASKASPQQVTVRWPPVLVTSHAPRW